MADIKIEILNFREVLLMPENEYQQYQPNHIGTKPKKYGNNKGAKYQNKGGNEPHVIQTKGE